MGGHAAGELASLAVIKALPPLVARDMAVYADLHEIEAAQCMKRIVNDISLHLNAKGKSNSDIAGLGSTVVLALVRGATALVVHLGDSRVFLFREQKLLRLTQDHSLMRLLEETGDISPEEALRHPARNNLTQFVGMDGDTAPDSVLVDLENNDRILLCSDGLTNMVDEDAIRAILMRFRAPEEVCQRLVNLANSAGGRDNITVVVAEVSTQEAVC
jgi:protein phosphatase